MANQLYNEQMQNSFNSQLNSFKNNPFEFLARKRGINIPQQFANDPHGAVQYMLNNNQISQDQLNMLMQRAQQMGFRF